MRPKEEGNKRVADVYVCKLCSAEYVEKRTLYEKNVIEYELEDYWNDLKDLDVLSKIKNLEYENRIKEYRKKLKISQRSLARRIGKPPQRLYEFEKNIHIPSIDIALKIALALGCRVEDIFILTQRKGDNSNENSVNNNKKENQKY